MQRETKGVIDGAGSHFIIANEAGEDGESGRIGAGPGVRTLLVGEKIPNGARVGVPGRVLRVGAVEFVEEAVGVVENEDVAIAGTRIGVALDGRSKRNGHRASVGFAAVSGVIDGDERLGAIDNGVRNAHVGAVIFAGPEVGMNADR